MHMNNWIWCFLLLVLLQEHCVLFIQRSTAAAAEMAETVRQATRTTEEGNCHTYLLLIACGNAPLGSSCRQQNNLLEQLREMTLTTTILLVDLWRCAVSLSSPCRLRDDDDDDACIATHSYPRYTVYWLISDVVFFVVLHTRVYKNIAVCCCLRHLWSTAMHQYKWKKRGLSLKRWIIQDCPNSHCHLLANQSTCMYMCKNVLFEMCRLTSNYMLVLSIFLNLKVNLYNHWHITSATLLQWWLAS